MFITSCGATPQLQRNVWEVRWVPQFFVKVYVLRPRKFWWFHFADDVLNIWNERGQARKRNWCSDSSWKYTDGKDDYICRWNFFHSTNYNKSSFTVRLSCFQSGNFLLPFESVPFSLSESGINSKNKTITEPKIVEKLVSRSVNLSNSTPASQETSLASVSQSGEHLSVILSFSQSVSQPIRQPVNMQLASKHSIQSSRGSIGRSVSKAVNLNVRQADKQSARHLDKMLIRQALNQSISSVSQ